MKTLPMILLTYLCVNPAFAETKHAAQITIDFDASEVGKLPADFSTALTGSGGPVSWVVQEDATAPSGKKILAQTSTDKTDYRFPLCVYDKFTAKDVEVS